MADQTVQSTMIDINQLRTAIQTEYETVANDPQRGFHFHTGRKLAKMLNYQDSWLENLPESTINSFAGTGNPFSLGELKPGEQVVDIGALLEAELQMTVVMAGFVGFEITSRKDVFTGAPQEGDAVNYGTVGINFKARKPRSMEEWHEALQANNCEIPM